MTATVVPGWMLTDTATITPRAGNSAHGPKWGDAVSVDCYCELQHKLVVQADGTTAAAALWAIFAPGTAISVDDKFTFGGQDYLCATVFDVDGDHIECDFTRLAT